VFKLHAVCINDGALENIFFTPGNTHKNSAPADLIVNLEGIFVFTVEYLLKIAFTGFNKQSLNFIDIE